MPCAAVVYPSGLNWATWMQIIVIMYPTGRVKRVGAIVMYPSGRVVGEVPCVVSCTYAPFVIMETMGRTPGGVAMILHVWVNKCR